MLRVHSASDGMISHLQDFAQKRDKRKKDIFPNDDIYQRIHDLEQKLADYEKRKAESLCMVIDIISPSNERINLLPIYKRLNFFE